MRSSLLLLVCTVLSACTAGTAPDARQTEAFSAIGAGETVRFVGTEPFWGGEVTGTRLTYSTPENGDGTTFAVERFAGNNGLSFSGELEGQSFDLMITPGNCSDGMSDRTFPFVASLKLGDQGTLSGCAWTEARPYQGSETP
ncbi:COG3650 family protein [Qipengyuania sp. MTN3-11]|uniref:COG3650 family protein n=1 Tax=Qipengyuania sp. MTN3-11 TaxID=3056557 RepID=UPI0036F370E7